MIRQRLVQQGLELVPQLLTNGFSLLSTRRRLLGRAWLNAGLAAWPLFIRQINGPIERSTNPGRHNAQEFLAGSREPYARDGVWFLTTRMINPKNAGPDPTMTARQIAADLPYLRRYARSLTGEQTRGDTYVRATLEAILHGDTELDPEQTPRVALYRVFHAIWDTSGATLEQDVQVTLKPDVTLQKMSPSNRKAFLLTTMEGFSIDDTSEILTVSQETVVSDVAAAHTEIDAALKTRVLIIEDEPIIAMDIEALVSDLGHEVIAVARTRSEAVALARSERPGLILADIQLADDSSGIDAVKDILTDYDVPVIFITAFPERLLSGERPEPTYLITKPFKPDTVKATIGQALFFQA